MSPSQGGFNCRQQRFTILLLVTPSAHRGPHAISPICFVSLLTVVSMLPACTAGNSAGTFCEINLESESVPTSEDVSASEAAATADGADPAKLDRTRAVELTLADLAQLSEIVKSQAGKVVVVDVWSTSPPGAASSPHLVALSHTDADKLACISLNVDYIGLKSKPPESYKAKVEEFLQKQQADKVINLLSSSTDEAVLGEFQLESIPAILIYAADGTLEHALTDANSGDDGLSYEGDVIPKVKELLAAQ